MGYQHESSKRLASGINRTITVMVIVCSDRVSTGHVNIYTRHPVILQKCSPFHIC